MSDEGASPTTSASSIGSWLYRLIPFGRQEASSQSSSSDGTNGSVELESMPLQPQDAPISPEPPRDEEMSPESPRVPVVTRGIQQVFREDDFQTPQGQERLDDLSEHYWPDYFKTVPEDNRTLEPRTGRLSTDLSQRDARQFLTVPDVQDYFEDEEEEEAFGTHLHAEWPRDVDRFVEDEEEECEEEPETAFEDVRGRFGEAEEWTDEEERWSAFEAQAHAGWEYDKESEGERPYDGRVHAEQEYEGEPAYVAAYEQRMQRMHEDMAREHLQQLNEERVYAGPEYHESQYQHQTFQQAHVYSPPIGPEVNSQSWSHLFISPFANQVNSCGFTDTHQEESPMVVDGQEPDDNPQEPEKQVVDPPSSATSQTESAAVMVAYDPNPVQSPQEAPRAQRRSANRQTGRRAKKRGSGGRTSTKKQKRSRGGRNKKSGKGSQPRKYRRR